MVAVPRADRRSQAPAGAAEVPPPLGGGADPPTSFYAGGRLRATMTTRPRFAVSAVLVLLLSAPLTGCLGSEDVGTPTDGENRSDGTDGVSLEWTSRAPVPTPRTEVATTILDGELVVVGGFESNNRPSVAVEALDLTEDTWRDLPPLPQPLHHSRAVAVAGAVHVFGGYNAIPFQAVPTHLFWEPGMQMWENASPLPNARGGHGAALVDGSVYLVGGVGADGELLETVDVYDASEDAWSTAEPLPTPRDHLAVAAAQGAIHAVGGRQQSFDTNTDRHEVLVPGEGWSEAEPMPTARGGIDAANVGGSIVVVGGEEAEGTFDEVEAYDPASGTWTSLPALPTPRHGLGVDGHEEALLTTAGGPEPGLTVSDAVEVLAEGNMTGGE